MSFLSRIRILPKILGVILLLAAVAGFGAWYSGQQMNAIDSGYSKFLGAEATARTANARLNRGLYQYEMYLYRLIAETSDEEMKKLPAQIDKAAAFAIEQAELIKTRLPGMATRYQQIETEIRRITNLGKPVVELALANKNDEATALLRTTIDPPLQKVMESASGYAVEIEHAMKSGTEKLSESSAGAIMTSYLIIGCGVGIALVIAFLVAQYGIARPITDLTGGMRQLADGKFDVVLAGLGRKDEIGDIAGAVEAFKIKAAEKARAEAEAKAEQDRRAAAQRKLEMTKIADGFEAAVGEIIETVSSASTELEAAAGTLTRTAETTQNLATRVASASEIASTNVQSVASASNEMASSVHEISRQVQESSRIANEAVRQAEKTDTRINELSVAASRIGDVVKLITAIAEQTNLLALNATIEAARAGEAGKGFAVVANEVKALAAQTGKATGEISSQIGAMQAATSDSVTAIKEIGGTIGKIAEIAATIAAAVEEQGAATNEIARNVQQASSGTTEVATNITEVDRGAAETGSASSQVLSSAQSLSSESNRLKLEVGKFLNTIRAA
ncbi:methyl-accepting chemotaxis protein [Rhodoplanes roseus]|uniref:Methyl-accepting chemotaxis protein n=1 Tax=Rhodoplanes roseus TaxID=29409 RepID=A0A327KMP0_9BRAD|nr:methyl-accepting chemotaxis protein [Rhodoplanes roseus]RAI39236.1 methyl-accepting chemotaxis protein [Rhodoplanes roseus]